MALRPVPDFKNIVLIGMPGAGKSTVGVLLAKRLGLNFVDTDLILQTRSGRRLQQIIDGEGLASFLHLEEAVLLDLRVRDTVVATGGSVVYSDKGMEALRRNAWLIFLDVPLAELERRVRDTDSRGLAVEPGETLADLFYRRLPLYRRYADLTVDCGGRTAEESASRVIAALKAEKGGA